MFRTWIASLLLLTGAFLCPGCDDFAPSGVDVEPDRDVTISEPYYDGDTDHNAATHNAATLDHNAVNLDHNVDRNRESSMDADDEINVGDLSRNISPSPAKNDSLKVNTFNSEDDPAEIENEDVQEVDN